VIAILKVEVDFVSSSRLNATQHSRRDSRYDPSVFCRLPELFNPYDRARHFFARGNPQKESFGANTTGVRSATVVIV
jgi:hypothetical protein